MVTEVVYLSNGEVFLFENGKTRKLEAEAVNTYKKTLQEIKKRKEWKSASNSVEMFGVKAEEASNNVKVNDIQTTGIGQVVYAAELEHTTALYMKNIANEEDIEQLLLRKKDLVVHELDYDPAKNRMVVSYSEDALEMHIALIQLEKTSFHPLTEGGSLDRNPVFDKEDGDCVYYDCCAIGYNSHHQPVGVGPRNISKLNFSNSDLDIFLAHDDYDYLKPKIDANRKLYCIKKPYATRGIQKMSLQDVILIPVKLAKAVFNWLDFFTRRYTGEMLNTGGANPAKAKQKSEEEIFIEGNLVNIHKVFKENEKSNEKAPGIIPKSWKLICIDLNDPGKREVVLKEGVLDYAIKEDGTILFSNGKYIIERDLNRGESVLCTAPMATHLSLC